MKKITVLLFLMSFITFAQQTKKVFFIGNSYTSYNNLPQLVQQIAASTNDILTYESHHPGGATFQQHASNPTVLNTINVGNWDYVVLQQQSQMPAFPINQVTSQTFLYATQLSTLIKEKNPCGNTLFYMTWGYKNGDPSNCNNLPYVCTYEGMDDKISERYQQMALDNEALLAPVGKVWRAIRQEHPDIELYSSDNSHPSYIGSMAAAYTFYTAIFKKDPTLTTFNGTLSSTEASFLKNIVKNVVFNEMEQWYLESHDTHSRFSSVFLDNQTVQFQNLSFNATTYLWNFGDGTMSEEENPSHSYQSNGEYMVSLTTNTCSISSTKKKTIIINSLSNDKFQPAYFEMYPNPANDYLLLSNIKVTEDKWEIYNINGQKVKTSYSIQQDKVQIDIRHLEKGTYLLHMVSKKAIENFKFIKN